MQSTATASQGSTTRAHQRAVDLAPKYQSALVQQVPSQLEFGCRRQQKYADTLTPLTAAPTSTSTCETRGSSFQRCARAPFHMLDRYDVRRNCDALEIGRMSPVAKKGSAYRDQLKTHKGKHHP